MLLIVEKGARGGIFEAIHQYLTTNIKYLKYNDKIKENSYLNYINVNNIHGWEMSQS